MNRKSKIIVSVVGITIVILALLGITYAYYLTRIEGNTNTNSISVSTADLKLKYDDGNGLIIKEDIMPGTTITKEFAITNEGDSKVNGYLVVLENVVNQLNRKEDLVYKLECKLNDGTSCGTTEENFYPSSSISIIFTNDINKNITQNYTLTVIYKNHDNIDQSEDMGKSFSGRVNIMDANTNIYKTGSTQTDNSNLVYNILNNAMKGETGTRYRYTPLSKPGWSIGEESYYLTYSEEFATTTPSNKYFVYGECVPHPALDPGIKEPKILENSNSLTQLIGKCVMNINGFESEEAAQELIDSTTSTWDGVDYIDPAYYSMYKISEETTDNELSYMEVGFGAIMEQSLSITQDNLGTSYYYRGVVQDNYVLFNDMCFRIVRIEGDGSVKLLFAGDVTSGATNCNEVGESTGFVKENGEVKKVHYGSKGYYYDYGAGDPDEYNVYYFTNYKDFEGGLKDVIESWFNSKFTNDILKDKIKTDKWCLGGSVNNIYDPIDKKYLYYKDYLDKYPGGTFSFTSEIRASNGKTSLMCENEDYDMNKYGTISSDEVMLAGGVYLSYYDIGVEDMYNTNYYINDNSKNQEWWLISYAGDIAISPSSFKINSYGTLTTDEAVYLTRAIRPAITLISGITISGGVGTKDNPYVIS